MSMGLEEVFTESSCYSCSVNGAAIFKAFARHQMDRLEIANYIEYVEIADGQEVHLSSINPQGFTLKMNERHFATFNTLLPYRRPSP